VVSSRPGAAAHYVSADETGTATERALPVRYLGDAAVGAAVLDSQPLAA
jgi:hypothetical protein